MSLLALPGYQLVGLPAVEIYHTTRVNVLYRLNHTDLCLPVVPGRHTKSPHYPKSS